MVTSKVNALVGGGCWGNKNQQATSSKQQATSNKQQRESNNEKATTTSAESGWYLAAGIPPLPPQQPAGGIFPSHGNDVWGTVLGANIGRYCHTNYRVFQSNVGVSMLRLFSRVLKHQKLNVLPNPK